MAELTETATEAVADAAEVVAEEATDFAEAARRLNPMVPAWIALGAAMGATAGAFVGYRWAYRRLEAKFADIAEQEIDSMRDHFRKRLVARDEKPPVEELKKVVKDAGYDVTDPTQNGEVAVAPVPEPETRNVFEDTAVDPQEDWDYEAELAQRSPEKPYVIHIDEYGEQEGHEEMSLTWYADDVLSDQQDKLVDDPNRVVGMENLDKFGHGSNDSTIVYIRNEKLGVDIEVSKSDHTYAQAVHGMDPPEQPQRAPRRDIRDE